MVIISLDEFYRDPEAAWRLARAEGPVTVLGTDPPLRLTLTELPKDQQGEVILTEREKGFAKRFANERVVLVPSEARRKWGRVKAFLRRHWPALAMLASLAMAILTAHDKEISAITLVGAAVAGCAIWDMALGWYVDHLKRRVDFFAIDLDAERAKVAELTREQKSAVREARGRS